MPSIAGLSGLARRLLHGSGPRPHYHSSHLRRFPVLITAAVVFVMALFYLLLSLAPCMVWGVCYHGYQSAFSFDAGLAHHPNWMAALPDDVLLSDLSIPGTHDTMTYDIGSERLQCQNWNLSMQLDAGLRYFDIRARLQDNELQIYHANGYTGFSFTNVLLAMFEFLDANPSEAIIMRLKQEGPPIGGKNTITFEDAFNKYRQKDPLTSSGAVDHLYLYNRTSPLPTLGDLRSRIFLLQQFPEEHGPYGLEWEGKQMALEDYWIIPDIYHLSDKWTAIRDALELAATAAQDNELLYLAHVSASVGVLPIEAAAGPLNRTMAGMNDMTGQWIEDFEENPDTTRTGVVILDFPGQRLINAILRWNEPLKHKARRSTSRTYWWSWTVDYPSKCW
ncbi:PLC-like phosphodiesterase [Thelonectria olida]|uniref:PLC-like phosphodiesterase n=1 Tax=Thelonectria olida TaxID=1576542 RepID=A0A9P9ATA1_9HYPO|nr:PLC-like phosphodiesterase [Thelonectria olida]